ncbi:hypothetical protein LTR36_005123 [Oleoguttula mirabilis]|uniref:Uncharacterized protein n=1 Tax=Oleoguttula mirabilis TaxID=1507867 RepID=A0AAV9JVR2_9PEZI|nr:hypothetical protein LTR36_005123 [Oleoguttula mirabilis]
MPTFRPVVFPDGKVNYGNIVRVALRMLEQPNASTAAGGKEFCSHHGESDSHGTAACKVRLNEEHMAANRAVDTIPHPEAIRRFRDKKRKREEDEAERLGATHRIFLRCLAGLPPARDAPRSSKPRSEREEYEERAVQDQLTRMARSFAGLPPTSASEIRQAQQAQQQMSSGGHDYGCSAFLAATLHQIVMFATYALYMF